MKSLRKTKRISSLTPALSIQCFLVLLKLIIFKLECFKCLPFTSIIVIIFETPYFLSWETHRIIIYIIFMEAIQKKVPKLGYCPKLHWPPRQTWDVYMVKQVLAWLNSTAAQTDVKQVSYCSNVVHITRVWNKRNW